MQNKVTLSYTAMVSNEPGDEVVINFTGVDHDVDPLTLMDAALGFASYIGQTRRGIGLHLWMNDQPQDRELNDYIYGEDKE